MKSSPTLAGWRTLWQEPALVLAEIVWRWIFGLIALLVLAFAVLAYLKSIQVPAPALWLMSTGVRPMISLGLLYALRGTGWVATKISLLVFPPLVLLWVFLASLGRTATLQPMLMFRTEQQSQHQQAPWSGLLGLGFLRSASWLAANVACAGALIFAFPASGESVESVGLPLLIFLPLTTVTLALWAALNWLLSLAAIFVVRDHADTFTSISLAVDLLARRGAEFMATSAAWGALRSIGLVGAIFLGVGVLTLPARVPPGFMILGAAIIGLAYFAFADLLYIGRLASYVAIIEADLEPSSATPAVTPDLPRDPDLSQLSPELLF